MKKLSFLLLSFLILSCSGLRHYKKVATDPQRSDKERALLAPVCSVEFPVKSSIDSVTVTEIQFITDTLRETKIQEIIREYQKDCPPAQTIYQRVKASVKPDTIKTTVYKTITQVKADSAAIFSISYKLTTVSAEREELQKDYDRKKKYVWWFWILLIVAIASHVLRSYLRI